MELYCLLLVVGLSLCVGSPLTSANSETSDCTAPSIPSCKKNEVYAECTNRGCEARNCSQLGKPVPCAKINPIYCIKGCECIEGFLRASNGECVEKDKCFKDRCPGPHEIFACGSACDTVCATLNEVCPIVNIKCNDMCYCEDGYARNKKGVCVRIEDCERVKKPCVRKKKQTTDD